MKVVVVSSLSRERDILQCKKYFENIGAEVTTPLEHQQDGSLRQLMINYIEFIGEADLIVVIPKSIESHVSVVDPTLGAYSETLYFGESSTYEMAIAERFGKKCVYWDM